MSLTVDSPKTGRSTVGRLPADRMEIYEAVAVAAFIVLLAVFAVVIAPALGG
jgi:hypothetical protein